MPSTTEPIHALRRQQRAVCAAAILGVLGCAAWAVLSGSPDAPAERASSAVTPEAEPNTTVDVVETMTIAFDAAIWNPKPPPPPPSEPVAETKPRIAPRPKPPVYALIAITNDAGVLSAVLYDPRTDELLTVADGDELGEYSAAVTADAVKLTTGPHSTTLSLATDAGTRGRRNCP